MLPCHVRELLSGINDLVIAISRLRTSGSIILKTDKIIVKINDIVRNYIIYYNIVDFYNSIITVIKYNMIE